MTAWFEGKNGFYLGAKASLVEDEREVAASWATPYVLSNPHHKYVLGRFVEADRANNNRQKFTLDGLQMGRPSIQNAPMNLNHESRHVVGTFVASELIYPTESPNEIATLNPYIESLGVVWRYYFRNEYAAIEEAHAEGRLYYSMECVPSTVQCTGDGGCEQSFKYAGVKSDKYCSHLNEHASDKLLIDPHFTAGAILIPPVKPGWSHADIHSLVESHASLAEDIYAGVSKEMSHLSPQDWESLMGMLLAQTV